MKIDKFSTRVKKENYINLVKSLAKPHPGYHINDSGEAVIHEHLSFNRNTQRSSSIKEDIDNDHYESQHLEKRLHEHQKETLQGSNSPYFHSGIIDHLREYTCGSASLNQSHVDRHLYGTSLDASHEAQTKALLSASTHTVGHEHHLYSGVKNWHPQEAANSSKEGVVSLPAFTSTSTSKSKARSFASRHSSDDKKHILKIHMKPEDRAIHLGSKSSYGQEHESILPAGTKLKYSHTEDDPNDSSSTMLHHFTVHDQPKDEEDYHKRFKVIGNINNALNHHDSHIRSKALSKAPGQKLLSYMKKNRKNLVVDDYLSVLANHNVNHKHLDLMKDHPDDYTRRLVHANSAIKEEDLRKYITNPNESSENKSYVLRHNSAVTSSHIDQMIDHHNESEHDELGLPSSIIKKMNSETLHKYINKGGIIPHSSVEQTNFTKEHVKSLIDKLPDDTTHLPSVTEKALSHAGLDSRHIDSIHKSNSPKHKAVMKTLLYNGNHKIEPEHLHSFIDNHKDDATHALISVLHHPKVDKSHIDKMFNTNNYAIHSSMASRGVNLLDKDQISKLIKDGHDVHRIHLNKLNNEEKMNHLFSDKVNTNTAANIIHNTDISRKHLAHIVDNHKNDIIRKEALSKMNHLLEDDSSEDITNHIERNIKNDGYIDTSDVVNHKNVKPEHISRMIQHGSNFEQSTINHPAITHSHIKEMIKSKNVNNSMLAVIHPSVKEEHLNDILLHDSLNKESSQKLKIHALSNPNINEKHISHALTNDGYVVRATSAEHPKANHEHLMKALSDYDDDVQRAAMRNKNINHEHISKAINSTYSEIRAEAAKHHAATAEHISKALDDGDWQVREAAAENKNANHEHLMKALSDTDSDIKEVAMRNPNITHEHISKAINDASWRVRKEAAKNTKIKPEDLAKALKDEDEDVREAAEQTKKLQNMEF